MARFRSRTKARETVKVGPFSFRLSKPLGRGRVRGSVGTRAGKRGRPGLGNPLGGRRRVGGKWRWK